MAPRKSWFHESRATLNIIFYVMTVSQTDQRQSLRLPPLRALQAFDAVMRTGGVVAAAQDLHVTPGAISQQIRQLEAFLGVMLFIRENAGLRPTRLAEAYHSHVMRGFQCFLTAQSLLRDQMQDRITFVTFPSVATHWLASRLDKWHAICPNVRVHVEVVDNETGFSVRNADIALTYGPAPADGSPSRMLLVDKVAPVFSPSLVADGQSIERASDILSFPLIHIEWGWGALSPPTWADWLRYVGVTMPGDAALLTYSLSGMAIDAAIRGKGVALGQGMFAIDSIETGALRALSGTALSLPYPYYLTWKRGVPETPALRQFIDWLATESEKTQQAIERAFGSD